jgi:Domain of unknown function (DUF222)
MPAEPVPGPGGAPEPLPRDASSPGAPGHSPAGPGPSSGGPGQEGSPGHLPHPGDSTRPGDDPALTDDRAQDDILDEIIAGSDDEARRLEKDEEDWDGEDPDCSCPREYIGVPLRETPAEAGAPEAGQAPAGQAPAGQAPAGQAPAAPEAWAAGFLPRGIPAAHPSPGPAGGFASGGALDIAPPDPVLAAFAEEVTGPDGRCAGTTDDELIGVLRAWQRSESRAAARKLAVIAELIRRRPAPGSAPARPAGTDGIPRAWDKFCGDELAAATACSGQAAEKTLTLAHDLATRLPGTARALHDGTIDTCKARIIADTTRILDDAGAAAAESLVLPSIEGKTPGQLRAAIARAVLAIDPAAARQRREEAQKDARVELWREDAGTAALCGRDLPPAEALAAGQHITAYARELKAAGLDGTMDQLRARAFLDLTLGVSSFPRPASPAPAADRGPAPSSSSSDLATSPDPDHSSGQGHPCSDHTPTASPRRGNAGADDPYDSHGPGSRTGDGSGSGTGDGSGSGTGDGSPAPGPDAAAGQDGQPAAPGAAGFTARINLTIPLTTLLGLAERPGDAHGLGAIDPALARTLAAVAAGNPHTTWCVTVTDQHGHPTAHGCARASRPTRARRIIETSEDGTRDGPAFAPETGRSPSSPDGAGAWRLRTPGPASRDLAVSIEPLAVTDCDHRHESAGYQPSDRLRHLVEIRDGECTFPPCRRHARSCDFEHALPYDEGGRTCACNAGARCRHHHHQKQDPGWRLDQHLPGYHTWTTPSGRTYTTGPATYPI